MAALMTDPQLGYIRKLADKHEVPVGGKTPEEAVFYERFMDALGGKPVSKQEAGWVIDWLKVQPWKAPVKPAAASTEEPSEGVYCAPSGDVVKLKKSKGGNLYAMVLVERGTVNRLNLKDEIVHFEWVYTPGIARHITPNMRLTKEQAADFGTKTARCMWCGRKLKDAESVLKAIGPICAKRFA